MKCNHTPKQLPAAQWNVWAEEQVKKGSRQTRCPNCRGWFFSTESITIEKKQFNKLIDWYNRKQNCENQD
ncbi:MAG: hypothetical protein KAS32_09425 [Candidatus Peribacteraceae bacterium]|nr:hypothetical protein [Candidatus Peribacteraceae bacterium]